MTQLALPLDQCQRWTHQEPSWRTTGERFQPRHYDVAPISHDAGRRFILAHHYSTAWPSASHCFGLHDRHHQLVGVAVVGCPTNAAVLTRPYPTLVPYVQALDLSRFCLVNEVPGNGESWFLARVRGLLRATTSVRALVAFSDPMPRDTLDGRRILPGHWGVIYQASSALALGRTRPRTLTLLPDGTAFNDRARSKLLHGEQGWAGVARQLTRYGIHLDGPTTAAVLDAELARIGVRKVRHPGVLRYGFPLARSVEVGLPVTAYPKAAAA